MNNLSCIIGITLILSSIIMSILNLKKDKFNIFVDMLDTEQKRKYNEIIVERITIYNIGMVVGVILGVLYYYYNKNDKDIFFKVITIMTVSNIGIYYFYPKKPLILNYLTDEKQVKAWADIYSTMKNRWMQSIVLGFIGYLFISYSMK